MRILVFVGLAILFAVPTSAQIVTDMTPEKIREAVAFYCEMSQATNKAPRSTRRFCERPLTLGTSRALSDVKLPLRRCHGVVECRLGRVG
jgi:hypothetical protein